MQNLKMLHVQSNFCDILIEMVKHLVKQKPNHIAAVGINIKSLSYICT